MEKLHKTTRRNPDGDKYYDSSVPANYSGLSGFIKNNKNFKKNKNLDCVTTNDHFKQTGPFEFWQTKNSCKWIDQPWQWDLCDIQNLHDDNDGYKYLLVNINVFFFEIRDCLPVEK